MNKVILLLRRCATYLEFTNAIDHPIIALVKEPQSPPSTPTWFTPTCRFAEWIEHHFPNLPTPSSTPTLPSELVLTDAKSTLALVKTLANHERLFRIFSPGTFTVLELKQALNLRDGVPLEQMYFIAKSRKLQDHWTLFEAGLWDEQEERGRLKWYVYNVLPIWKGETRELVEKKQKTRWAWKARKAREAQDEECAVTA